MTAGTTIDYDALTQDALRGVVRAVLEQIGKTGLPGDHHFYIAFDTQAAGVVMSRRLKEKYPDEMMIVLQHRFWDLGVAEEGFEVKLTFDGIPERLYVPYQALRVFHDPSVRFTLQFGEQVIAEDGQDGSGRRRRDGGETRGAGDRRTRLKPRARSEIEPESPERAPAQSEPAKPEPVAASPVPSGGSAPAVFTPRAIEPKRPAAVPAATTASAEGEAAEPAAAGPPPGGAKVFSLDQFRKK